MYHSSIRSAYGLASFPGSTAQCFLHFGKTRAGQKTLGSGAWERGCLWPTKDNTHVRKLEFEQLLGQILQPVSSTLQDMSKGATTVFRGVAYFQVGSCDSFMHRLDSGVSHIKKATIVLIRSSDIS